MNDSENSILKVVAAKLEVVDAKLETVKTNVTWIKEGQDQLRVDFKCKVGECNERFDSQDKKIENNKSKIWKLITAVCVLSTSVGAAGGAGFSSWFGG